MADFPDGARSIAGPRRLLDEAEVAKKLGHDRAWFARRSTKNRLRAIGFPDPIPGLRRWDERAVDLWLAPPPAKPDLTDWAACAAAASAAIAAPMGRRSNWTARADAAAEAIAAEITSERSDDV